MKLRWPFGDDAAETAAGRLYRAAVRQSREPEFYRRCGVPDTVDGRFDMITLHTYLILRRLGKEPKKTKGLAQAVFDTMFADMDQNLREMGVGDLGVSRRIKQMVAAFYGRISAYDAALSGEEEAGEGEAGEGEAGEGGAGEGKTLDAALVRNLYRGKGPGPQTVSGLAGYVRREAAGISAQSLESLMGGEVRFGPPPGISPDGAVEDGEA